MANTAMLRRERYCWSIVDGRWGDGEMGVLKYEKKSLGKRKNKGLGRDADEAVFAACGVTNPKSRVEGLAVYRGTS
jgi:hypothetical protein